MTKKDDSVRRDVAVLVIFLVGLAGLLSLFSILVPSDNSNPNQNNFFSSSNAVAESYDSFHSYSELKNYIATNEQSAMQYSTEGSFAIGGPQAFDGGLAASMAPEASSPPSSTSSIPTYTGTNVQVAGIDEPDYVKTDGTHLYVATGNAITIIDAYQNSTSVLSTINFTSFVTVQGMEISQDRLLVINERYSNQTPYVDLLLYNTTELAAPRLFENYSIVGNYVAARLTGDYFYAVIQEPTYTFTGTTSTLPEITDNGASTTIPLSSIYYTPNNMQTSYYTIIVSVGMSLGQEKAVAILTGPSSTIYVSSSNIYVVYTDYPMFYADNIPGDVFGGGVGAPIGVRMGGGENSTVFRAGYSNGTITLEAAGSVPGSVLNQFSMDEYDGYFRLATSGYATSGNYSQMSDDVFVLNENMSQAAVLRNIAPGENLYAVRFVGDTGYVVTFEQVDPLFAISFQDVTHPVIESALRVNGYSDYLQPLAGGYLIGVGKDTVAATGGDYAYYLGLKLSLFRIENGTSTDVSNYLIGDRGTDSPVLTDHLAFTFDPTRNIFVIPVLLAKVSGGGSSSSSSSSPPPFGNYVWQGAYVFSVNGTGFTLLGTVSQYPPSVNYSASANNDLDITRSVIIGNYLYTVSSGEVMVSSLSTFTTLGTVPLPPSQSGPVGVVSIP